MTTPSESSASAPAVPSPASSASPSGPPSGPSSASPPAGGAIDADARFLSRDLQWLEFNRRVLHQALDPRTPLLERVRFLAIYASNLDEFFMKRVGGLHRQMDAGIDFVAYEGISPARLLEDIRARIEPLIEIVARCYRDELVPALREQGIELLGWTDLDEQDRAKVRDWYRGNVHPLLTPLAVDPGHRFPFISNLSTSMGIMLRRPGDEEPTFARVKVPDVAGQWHRIDEDGRRFVLLADVIEHNLQDLFPGMEILEVLPFRVTRNADIEGDDEDAVDLLEQIQQQLRERRFAPVVRMQIARNPAPGILEFLCRAMELEPRDIYETSGLINYRTLDEIADLPAPDLHFEPWEPVTPARLEDQGDIFRVIAAGDLLVHHPYESFHDSVERFIRQAAADPQVLGIKQALYRTSGDSPFVHGLIQAAESDKQVAVLVELRARFDEARNIRWARTLEEAGVHVTYGVVGLKTHTKIALVVRREQNGLRCYAHVGTGNYHSKTARLYEDVGLFTDDPDITADVVDLFNFITGRSREPRYRKLLVAPHSMKSRFIEMIRRETELVAEGRPGRIIAKMNQLQDREMIEALYDASQAGVSIDIICRGFCTLRPGVPGMSDNIRVSSIIGRFLEHSRIFWFGCGEDDPIDGSFHIGSADWMYRNLNNRVEAICPVEDRAHRARLWNVLQTELQDRRQAWDMQPDGGYRLREADPEIPDDDDRAIGTHAALMRDARRRRDDGLSAEPA